ncbi:hypothetical protein M514_07625 [Trichuris suis]|uniref:Protein kinase domain-containing protein n=1 Tax=Trichuris suis TaxID=68888 RepID=A0A085N8E4_9BILA|nr:hypothetical protein M513_07625 [Trichuris suis]KFD65740.1 hypothetical protein M514_07625 [Trichuris suis]
MDESNAVLRRTNNKDKEIILPKLSVKNAHMMVVPDTGRKEPCARSRMEPAATSDNCSKQRNADIANRIERGSQIRGRPLANAASLQNSPNFRCANKKNVTKLKENLNLSYKPSGYWKQPLEKESQRLDEPRVHVADGNSIDSQVSELHDSQEKCNICPQTEPTEKAKKTPRELMKTLTEPAPKVRIIELHGKAYSVGKRIGEGGTAKVYTAMDVDSNREYALKWIDLSKCDQLQMKVLNREIEILEKLKQVDLVVKLIDHEYKQNDFLIMLLEKGRVDLSTHFKTFDYKMSPRMIVRYWLGMLRAVNEIHKIGVIHADLKPSNFVLSEGKVKLIDFGISNLLQSEHRSVTQVALLGTVGYMSPEALCARQEGGMKKIKVSTKTDVWSLGVILYRMIYGKLPFDHIGSIAAQIVATCNPKIPIALPETNNPFARDALACCLHRNPRKRPTVENLISHPYVTQYFPNSADS